MGRRALRGGAKGYCKNANRTSPGGFAERLGGGAGPRRRGRDGGMRGGPMDGKMLPRPGGSSARWGLFPSADVAPTSPDETIAVGEKRGVYEVALVAGSHRRWVVARSAPAFDVEGRPSLEQLGAGPSPILIGGEGGRDRCRQRGGERELALLSVRQACPVELATHHSSLTKADRTAVRS